MKPKHSQADVSKTVPFGYQQVEEQKKNDLVQGVFTRVASQYDVMNDAMSLGMHRYWKAYLVRRLRARPDKVLLDLAGGTGDISRSFVGHGGGHAIVYDLNYEMIDAGRSKDASFRHFDRLSWMQGDAEKLPLKDESVDLVSIVFGLRNTTHPTRVIGESLRVLKPGGSFYCMDFAQPKIPIVRECYNTLSKIVLPGLGSLIARDAAAYRYLHESIRTFVSGETLSRWFRETGYCGVRCVRLTGGIVVVVSGVKA